MNILYALYETFLTNNTHHDYNNKRNWFEKVYRSY